MVIGHDTCNSRSQDLDHHGSNKKIGVSEVIPLRSKSRQVGQNEARSRSSDHHRLLSCWALCRSWRPACFTSTWTQAGLTGCEKKLCPCGLRVTVPSCQVPGPGGNWPPRPLALIGQGGVHQDATEQMNDACSVRVSSWSGNGRAEEDRSWVEFLRAWFTSRVVQRSSFLYPSDHFLGPSGSFWSVSKAVLPARVPDKLCHRLDWL